ncbi:MAG: acyltransferase [Chitinophagaceae bacterium]|nr:acyltransferase [Chitinophagaceae bacterium]
MQTPLKNKTFYPALEGLRGIAIIAVIIFHTFPYGDSLFGWLGVDLFFVLSGFLITGILMKSFDIDRKSVFLKNFYIRRILRIFPLYYMFLFAFLFLFPALGIFNGEVSDYQNHKLWFIFYLQNWLFTNNFPETSHCLNHFWSLAVEEQYYIFWPIIIFILRKPKKLVAFLISFLVFLFAFRCITWYEQYPHLNYTTLYTFTRLDGICVGSLVALVVLLKRDFLRRNTALIVFLLAVLNFIFYFINSSGDLPYLAFIGYTTFAVMFGILVYELAYGNSELLKMFLPLLRLDFWGKFHMDYTCFTGLCIIF